MGAERVLGVPRSETAAKLIDHTRALAGLRREKEILHHMVEWTDEGAQQRTDLSGRVAWITGASGGLGRGLAAGFADAGATVVLTSRSVKPLEDLERSIAERGGSALCLPGSIVSSAEAARMANAITSETGRLDILINNAGISPTFKRAESVTDEEWNGVLDTNLTGTFYCCREAGKVMLAAGQGSIINVTSVHGTVGAVRMAAYSASKGGLEMLTRSLALEWVDRGVRVNALAPGYVDAGVAEPLLESRWRDLILDRIPARRFGTVAELAHAALYLASDGARYVTGTTLVVDGGWTAQ